MTYSIVARDPETGSLGVAVQSAWFAVGHAVPWVNAGVGVVATQAFADPSYGPKGLALMRNGLSAETALSVLVDLDDMSDRRQVAMVDGEGKVGVFTGANCIRHAEHVARSEASCQGNLLACEGIPEAMMTAYEQATGEFVDRLLAAMRAAETMGGDARGAQSAALLVVRGQGQRDLYIDRQFDVRVDDHVDPVSELERIVGVQRVYRQLDVSSDMFFAGDHEEATAQALSAVRGMPDDINVVMWGLLTVLGAGRDEEVQPLVERARLQPVDWADLWCRLADADELPEGVELATLLELTGAGTGVR